MSLKRRCKAFNGRNKKATQCLGCLVVMTLACGVLRAQNLTINWPLRQFSGCPAEVSRARTVNVIVSGVNTILYQYKIDIQETARVSDDFSELQRDVERAPALREPVPEGPCQTAAGSVREDLKAVQSALGSDALIPKKNDQGKYRSVPRDETEKAWLKVRTAVKALDISMKKAESSCKDTPAVIEDLRKGYAALETKIEAIQKRVDSPRDIQVSSTLRPDNDYTITVEELYDGQTTDNGKRSFECKPRSGIVTLSAGYLLTSLPDQAYVRRPIPGAKEDDAANSILAVEGTGKWHPTGVALLNYQIPHLNREECPVGITFSSGPVVKIGSKTDTSTFGLFAGFSLHLWRRLFLTPGWHVGEFAEFPPGFREGSIIPSSITELNPVKRWTTRFAFGITYRTASLADGSTSGAKKTDQKGSTEPNK